MHAFMHNSPRVTRRIEMNMLNGFRAWIRRSGGILREKNQKVNSSDVAPNPSPLHPSSSRPQSFHLLDLQYTVHMPCLFISTLVLSLSFLSYGPVYLSSCLLISSFSVSSASPLWRPYWAWRPALPGWLPAAPPHGSPPEQGGFLCSLAGQHSRAEN